MPMQRPRSSRFHSGFDLIANHSALHRRILSDRLLSIFVEWVLSPTQLDCHLTAKLARKTTDEPCSWFTYRLCDAAACKMHKQDGIPRQRSKHMPL
jgi:hypothetical protein